jgi:hypothetical protein
VSASGCGGDGKDPSRLSREEAVIREVREGARPGPDYLHRSPLHPTGPKDQEEGRRHGRQDPVGGFGRGEEDKDTSEWCHRAGPGTQPR